MTANSQTAAKKAATMVSGVFFMLTLLAIVAFLIDSLLRNLG